MFDVYTRCLSNAIMHRRAAVQIELAIGLCVAHDFDDAAEARAMLVNVYAASGYNCLSPDGNDYKTINRRVNTSFLLFDKIGRDAIHEVVAHRHGHHRVEAAQELLRPLVLCSYDDVLAYCGRPRSGGLTKPAAVTTTPPLRRAADAPGAVHVRTPHIDVVVPPTATSSEVMDLVVRLVALAEKRNKISC